jgi:hypothetical protein
MPFQCRSNVPCRIASFARDERPKDSTPDGHQIGRRSSRDGVLKVFWKSYALLLRKEGNCDDDKLRKVFKNVIAGCGWGMTIPMYCRNGIENGA